MPSAKIAPDPYSARLEALRRYDILDTPPEAEYDDLVAIAAEVCEVPIALVNFLDEGRDFLKAQIGAGTSESPSETSFCRFAIRDKQLMIVSDTLEDERFRDNPLVTEEPHLRFYAGAVIETPDGFPIGTVCVFDVRPRTLNVHQQRTLKLLAHQARTQLELRRTLKEREEGLIEARRLAGELRAAVDRQRDIAREMAHRMKNSFAMVQAVVSQTFRKAETLQSAQDGIAARLTALSSAQDALLSSGSEDVDIASVVEISLAPHRSGEGRFHISGPPFALDAQRALGLSLGLHELSTNAAKYGALSSASGRISVTWRVDDEKFWFSWVETDGPAVEKPNRSGFGSRIIERIVGAYFSGQSRLTFEPGGIVFELTGPVKV